MLSRHRHSRAGGNPGYHYAKAHQDGRKATCYDLFHTEPLVLHGKTSSDQVCFAEKRAFSLAPFFLSPSLQVAGIEPAVLGTLGLPVLRLLQIRFVERRDRPGRIPG